MDITCPSGLAGVIRGLRGKEAQAFVDPTLVRTHGSMDRVFGNCWLETANPGPYKLTPDGKIDWRTTLIGDRFDALCKIRCLTMGPDYPFNVKCESCEKSYEWEINLNDLPRRLLPTTSFQKLQDGENRFELGLPDGSTFVFKLGTGEEEVMIAKLKGGANSTKKLGPVDAACVQALDIIDVEGKPLKMGATGIRRYLEELDYDPLMILIKDMQDPDCGVDTTFETVCTYCDHEQTINLPFQRTFFERRQTPKKA